MWILKQHVNFFFPIVDVPFLSFDKHSRWRKQFQRKGESRTTAATIPSIQFRLQKVIHVDYVLNVMAHEQKPDFVFRWNGRVHLNRLKRQLTIGSRGVRISVSNAGYTTFRGSVKGTGYSLHSPVSPSLTLPSVTVCHLVSTGLFYTSSECMCSHTEQVERKYPNPVANYTTQIFPQNVIIFHTV
jgi:hypothetical protein